MNTKEFAQELRDVVADLKAKGVESIESEKLIKYLDEVIRAPDTLEDPAAETAMERYKVELQKWLEEHRSVHAQNLEMLDLSFKLGRTRCELPS